MKKKKLYKGVVNHGEFQLIVRTKRFSSRSYEYFTNYYKAYHAFRHYLYIVNPYYVELLYINHYGDTISIVTHVCTDSYLGLFWYRGRSNHTWWFDYGD